MKECEIGRIVGTCIGLSGLDKVPWCFIKECVARDMGRAKSHTEEATIMFVVVPGGLISLITMRTIEEGLWIGSLFPQGRKSMS